MGQKVENTEHKAGDTGHRVGDAGQKAGDMGYGLGHRVGDTGQMLRTQDTELGMWAHHPNQPHLGSQPPTPPPHLAPALYLSSHPA